MEERKKRRAFDEVLLSLEETVKNLEEAARHMRACVETQKRTTQSLVVLRDAAKRAALICQVAARPRIDVVFSPEQEDQLKRSIVEIETTTPLTFN